MSVDEIRSFVIETFLFGNTERLTDTTPLLESHIVDSTGILEIVMFLEDRYGIRIEDNELTPDNLNSIERIASMLKNKGVGLV
jgi:acyl carrier protein